MDDVISKLAMHQEPQLLLSQFSMDNASIGVFWVGRDGQILYANNHACKSLGYNREELKQLSLAELDPQYPIDQWNQFWLKSKQVRVQTFETQHKRKDGVIIPVEIESNFISLGDHEFCVGFVKDISERKNAEARLSDSKLLAEATLNSLSAQIAILDERGTIVSVNHAWRSFAVANSALNQASSCEGVNYLAVCDKVTGSDSDDSKAIAAGIRAVLHGELPEFTLEYPCHSPDEKRWFIARVTPFSGDGMARVVLSHESITERKKAEAELKIAAVAFEAQEGMMVTDRDGKILRVNKAFCDISGYSADEVIGKSPRILSSERHDAAFYASMWNNIKRLGFWDGEVWNKRKNGEIYPEHLIITAVKDQNDIVSNYVGTFTDITMNRNSADEIQHLAFYDTLTRIPNRRLLLDRLKLALASSIRSGNEGALLFLDLDNFKIINDTLGHDIGDLLLQQAAKRIESCVREGDTLARLGGDEFVVMLEGLSQQSLEAAAQTEAVGTKILSILGQPYQLAGHDFQITVSIGATLFNNHKAGIDELFKQADIAMYQSKKAGRNTLRFFDQQMQASINERATLEKELNKAIAKRQFQLHYQVQVDSNRRALGAEALIRWKHPERGFVSPMLFIPLAEETGQILPIGKWVLETACAQLKAWQQNDFTRHLTISVNVSAKQFHEAAFVDDVLTALQRYDINPSLLKLEPTESILMENIEEAIATMNELKAIGVHFALDDFGTGFSSLQYLKKLPLNQLKIDQAFVRDLVSGSNDQAIVKTIIAMAQSLNLEVIAEGVETKEQQQILQHNGCNHYQGYLFGKPVPIEEFEAMLKKD